MFMGREMIFLLVATPSWSITFPFCFHSFFNFRFLPPINTFDKNLSRVFGNEINLSLPLFEPFSPFFFFLFLWTPSFSIPPKKIQTSCGYLLTGHVGIIYL